MPTKEDLLVDLTLHGFPACLLEEFVKSIVKPYYSGNLNEAIRDLVRKAMADEEFVRSHLDNI